MPDEEGGADLTARVLMGSFLTLASRLVNALSLFLVSITLARYLGIEQYGLIAIATGLAGMLEVVGALGMNTGSARYIPYYNTRGEGDDARRVVSINLTTKVGMSVMLGTLLYLLAGFFEGFFDKPIEPLVQIAAIVLAVNVLGGAFHGVLRGLQRLGVMALANIVRDVVWAATSIALVVVEDLGPEGALWGFVAGAVVWIVISAVLMVRVLRTDMPSAGPLERRYDPRVIRALMTFGVPVLISNLLFMIFDWTDTYVIAYFRPIEDVSVYNVAFGIVAIPLVLTASLGMAMLPAMSQAFAAGRMELIRTLWRGTQKLVNLALFPVAMLLATLSVPAVLLLYGADYVPGAVPLSILALYLLFKPTGMMSLQVLSAMAHQSLILRVNLVSVSLNIALNIVLVPMVGIVGAACATTASFIVNSLLLYGFAWKMAGLRMDGRGTWVIVMSSLAAAVIGGGIFVLTDALGEGSVLLFLRLAVSTLAGLGAYLLMVRRFRAMSDDDLLNARSVAGKSGLAALILRLLDR